MKAVFFALFSRINSKYIPYIALIISIILVSVSISFIVDIARLRDRNQQLYGYIKEQSTLLQSTSITPESMNSNLLNVLYIQNEISSNNMLIEDKQKKSDILGSVGSILFIYSEIFVFYKLSGK
jgi:hypothetical protein